MALNSNVYTAAGTQVQISATLPATHDIPGFEAVSFTNIAELVDGGSGGKQFNTVDHSPLAEREVIQVKGSFTQGTRDLGLGRNISDPGQQIVLDALDSDNLYSFKMIFSNGDINYFTSRVLSYGDDVGTIDTIIGGTVSTSQQCDTIRLVATGVLTTSINAGGTFTTVTDGTFAATQASTSGSGVGAEFEVTLAAGAVTAAFPTKTGSGYVVTDTITLTVLGGPVESVAAILDVDTIVAAL